MNYQEMYKKKLTTADEAVKVVKTGDWLDYGWCVMHARDLDKALAGRAEELTDIKIRGGILMWPLEIAKVPNAKEKFTWNSWHSGGLERKMMTEGMAFYGPIRYSELPRYYREHVEPIDVAMFQVAPMNEHGWFNFGIATSHLRAMIEKSKVIIVEVNPKLPYCFGGHESNIHISEIDMVVESTNPQMAMLPSGDASDVDEIVANLIVKEIPDNACLQLGIGGMPNAIGTLIAKSDLKGLGVHTEMYSEGFVDIANAGKITGMNKSLDRGLQVYSFAAGGQKLYDYLNNNPACYSAPVDYTNDVRVISQIDNFMSINNAVNIDLFGQICSETAGLKHISGAGGQLDFVMGAYLSEGGKSFVCLSSTVTGKDGKLVSRLLPVLAPGSVVTDTRPTAHYIVTEYGMVNVKGMATWQRAEAIISLAHPDFREELIEQADKMLIWRKSRQQRGLW